MRAPAQSWQIVQRTERAILVDIREDAVGWLVARLGELIDAGLYDELYPAEGAAEAGRGRARGRP